MRGITKRAVGSRSLGADGPLEFQGSEAAGAPSELERCRITPGLEEASRPNPLDPRSFELIFPRPSKLPEPPRDSDRFAGLGYEFIHIFGKQKRLSVRAASLCGRTDIAIVCKNARDR